jgi:uncharacterized protein DUF6912
VTVRVYRPATLADLARLVEDGELPPAVDVVVAPDDDEETEYDALMTAAELSAVHLGGSGRRVVVVAETDGEDAPVRLEQVVAVHADTTAETAPDEDLGWYAPSEIRYLADESR